MTTDPAPDPLEQPAGELAAIQADVLRARAELADLQGQLALVRARLSDSKAARLVEANEQLVLAALASQRAAQASEQAVRELTEAAEVDALTGLANTAVFRARLGQALAAAGTRDRVALLLLNLADFKLINDTLGHARGDQVLQVAAQSLTASALPGETICRYRGNEFLVLLPDLCDTTQAVVRATALTAALGAPARIDDHVLRLTANVGISIFPDDANDADGLIGRAVAAMYRAKWGAVGSFTGQGEPPVPQLSSELRALEALRRPLIDHQSASVEHDRRHGLLQEANTQLLLAALNAQELRAAAEDAQQRQTAFLGVLAHELRTPLGPIRTAAALLSHIPAGGPKLDEVQAVIERQVKTVARLVEDLLDVARVNAGKLRFQFEPVDMGQLIDDVIRAVRPALDTRLQQLVIQLPPDPPGLRGDPVRLTQVLTNLLDNASKYTPKGGEVRFTVTVEEDDSLVLTVADNGIGITPEALEHIFEPFVQEQHATLFNASGLGVGLTVVRELVEGHGGQVTASSGGKGQGSSFMVRLPIDASSKPR